MILLSYSDATTYGGGTKIVLQCVGGGIQLGLARGLLTTALRCHKGIRTYALYGSIIGLRVFPTRLLYRRLTGNEFAQTKRACRGSVFATFRRNKNGFLNGILFNEDTRRGLVYLFDLDNRRGGPSSIFRTSHLDVRRGLYTGEIMSCICRTLTLKRRVRVHEKLRVIELRACENTICGRLHIARLYLVFKNINL